MIRDSLKSEKTYQIIPGIVYCQKWMKNQYIILCKNTTAKKYELTLTYNPKSLKNCQLGLKKQDNKLIYKIRAKDGSNMGTI